MADAAERWTRIQTLFEQAQERPPDERTAWLRSVCGEDREVYDHVSAMLDGAQHEHGLFGGRALDLVEDSDELVTSGLVPSRAGDRVGPWVLGERIGVGGMGAVYRAERDGADTPGGFEQTAALKSIKLGMDSEAVLARFRAERQILARLEHPGIARLLDGGLDDDGRPYFAMELVAGEPITDYADARQLGVRARLALFARVCDAVAYAHRQLVVHRDLKPSNVLVGEPDDETGAPQVKLLDFGIARVLSDDDDGDLTRTGQRVFTPGYAAPEQIRGEATTTSTDVYALGVLLYRLLSGARPIETEGRSTFEIEQAVLDEAPSRPSAAVAPDAARARGATPDELVRALRGDLDVICLKALDKDPERRYGSAAELLADIRRHREGFPIEARPATRWYRTGLFVRRHRAGVAAVAVALAAVVGGAGLAMWQAAEARAQRDRAETEAEKATEVSAFLESLFETADPARSLGQTMTAREMLDDGSARLEEGLSDQPAVLSRMHTVVGRAYLHLDLCDEASAHAAQARSLHRQLGMERTPEAVDALMLAAQCHYAEREYDRMAALHDEVASILAAEGLTESPIAARLFVSQATLSTNQGDYERAEQQAAEAIQIASAQGEDVVLAQAAGRRLYALSRLSRRQEADAFADSMATELRRREVDPASRSRFASTASRHYLESDRPDQALRLARASVAELARVYGDEHRMVLSAREALGLSLLQAGDLDAAETTLRSVYVARSDADDVSRARGMQILALAVERQGRLGEAEQLLAEAYRILVRQRGASSEYTVGTLMSRGVLLRRLDRFAEAERALRSAREGFVALFGEDHRGPIIAGRELGMVYRQTGRYAEAEPVLLEAHASAVEVLGETHSETQRNRFELYELYKAWGRPRDAAAYAEEPGT